MRRRPWKTAWGPSGWTLTRVLEICAHRTSPDLQLAFAVLFDADLSYWLPRILVAIDARDLRERRARFSRRDGEALIVGERRREVPRCATAARVQGR
jgi:hypothetical protein